MPSMLHTVVIQEQFTGLATEPNVERVRFALARLEDDAGLAISDTDVSLVVSREIVPVRGRNNSVQARLIHRCTLILSVTVVAHDKEVATAVGLAVTRRAKRDADWRFPAELLEISVLTQDSPVALAGAA